MSLHDQSSNNAAAVAETASAPLLGTSPAAGRLLSLDVFRGATLAAMLIANNPGEWRHKFPAFGHAAWHGVTFTDLIFPGFVFIMGVAMTFSFARRLAEGGDKRALFIQMVRRTLLLILLGLFLQTLSYLLLRSPDSERLFRYPGVLQRLALCYFFAGLVLLAGARARGQAIVAAVLLVGYHCLMKYVPVPGFGAGQLGRDGGNWASYIDDKVFGAHAYMYLKESKQWHDPEGLLSTLPAVASCLLGTITGYLVRDKAKTAFEKVSMMMVWGFVLVTAGLTWGYFFPINKNLWTSSFVLVAGGWALLGLGACYYCLDIRKVTWWCKPFVVLGTNAIVTYVSVGVFTILSLWIKFGPEDNRVSLKAVLYENLIKSWAEPLFGPNVSSLSWGLFYIGVWTVVIGLLLFRRGIFVRI